MSDKDIIKDFLYKEYEEEGDPDNYISSITTHPDYTMSLLARKRVDPFYTVVERLPEGAIDIRERKIGATDFYYKGSLAGVYLNKTFESNTVKDVTTVRFDNVNRFSYVTRVLGFLNTTPYAGWRGTYYSRNRWGDTNRVRNIFEAGVNNSTKFYRAYDVTGEYGGIEVNKLRHIIMPSANYYHVFSPSISPSNLHQFDGIDAFEKENGIKLSIENKLQTKQKSGDTLSSVDLATLIVSTDYQFTLKKRSATLEGASFKGIDFQLELEPYPWLYSIGKMTVNTKDKSIRSSSIDCTASESENWSLGFGHRYESEGETETNLFTTDIFYKIDPKWSVRLYERIDALNGKMEEQELTLYRDLHCWLGEVTYNIKGSITDPTDQTFWVVFRLKAFPELPLGFRRSYSRARPGAAKR
ncbi:MAG: hypothetical protein ABIJ27_04415 [Candidatus Omnitrophota bacterium]